jgi:hypothetical protein
VPAGRLGRVLRPLLGREVYECLTLDWPGGQAAAVSPADSGMQIRAVDRTELSRLSADAACGISQKFLRSIERTADLCFGAFAGEALVSYVFFAPASPIAIDARLQFAFPADWIYVYKAFTRPAWRGERLFHQVLVHGMSRLGPQRFVTLVEAGNQASRKAFERCGFQPTQRFPVWRVLSRPWPRTVRDPLGFSVMIRSQHAARPADRARRSPPRAEYG